MEILYVGHNYVHECGFYIKRPVGCDQYILLLIKSPAFLYIDGIKKSVPKNSLILFNKHTPQHFGSETREYINDWITFDLNPEEEKIYLCNLPLDTLMPCINHDVISTLIGQMEWERCAKNNNSHESMLLIFELIILKIKDEQHIPRDMRKFGNDLQRIKGEIYSHPESRDSIGCFAERLHISKSHFSHLYQSYFGTTPNADMIRSRMDRAKYLLDSTDYSVKEIAGMLGYCSDIIFMSQFKKHTGLTPTKYRKGYL